MIENSLSGRSEMNTELSICSWKNARVNAGDYDLLIRRLASPLPGEISAIYKDEWEKKEDEAGLRVLNVAHEGKVRTLRVLSLEAKDGCRGLRKALQLFRKCSSKNHFEHLTVLADFEEPELLLTLAKEILLMGKPSFHLKTSGYTPELEKKSEDKPFFHDLKIVSRLEDTGAIEKEARVLADAIYCSQELVNLPANRMTPRLLAERAKKEGERCGFDVFVGDREWIQKQGLKAYWQVARGSDEEPFFIVMNYQGNPDSTKKLALVGKGLCYDSGGYDIKSGSGMVTMFTDMAGSAAVIGALSALAESGAPVNVVGIVAACENMISGHAYRNGDIIDSYAGKTIEIVSTDAEGRLTLADAVTYAWKDMEATAIIEASTLTGAVGVALGDLCIGAVCDNEELKKISEKASVLTGDRVFQLPADEEYAEINKSDRADIKNGGSRMAGASTAGLFVRSFANFKPFLHLDIAYLAYRSNEDQYGPAGATGVGAELMYQMARGYFEEESK